MNVLKQGSIQPVFMEEKEEEREGEKEGREEGRKEEEEAGERMGGRRNKEFMNRVLEISD